MRVEYQLADLLSADVHLLTGVQGGVWPRMHGNRYHHHNAVHSHRQLPKGRGRPAAGYGGCTLRGMILDSLILNEGVRENRLLTCTPDCLQGVLSLLFNILSLSFYGGVHANSYASEHSDFTHAKLGPAWVLTLIGSIISFLTLPANIVDLALPEAKRRNVRPASSINPSAILSGLLPAAKQMAPGGGGNVNMNEPAAVH